MPHPENIRKLCAIFETTPAQLGLREEEWADPPVVPTTQDEAVEDFIGSSMTLSLWSLAFQRQSSPTSVANQIRRAIKDFDAMNTTYKNYQTTRREALCALATMPFVTLGLSAPESTLKTSQFSEALVQCAASIEACWELFFSNNTSDIRLAFQCASKCGAILDVNNPWLKPRGLSLVRGRRREAD